MWGGLVLEFEIVGNAEDAIISPAASREFLPTDTSVSWQIEDVRCVGDVVTLDSALQNSYAEHVLSGKSLPINDNTYITMQQTVSGENISDNVSRAVSRLKTIFLSCDSRNLINEGQVQYMKEWNIDHPMNVWPYKCDRELEYQVQIGCKMIPEYSAKSASQAWYELKGR